MPRPITLPDILEVMADAVPERHAFISEYGVSTYAELDERATRLANHLVGEGIRPGDHIAIHAPNSVRWAESFYGILKARAVPINVNYRYVHKELMHVYANSEAVAAVVAPEYLDAVREVAGELPGLRTLLTMGEEYDRALAAASAERRIGGRTSDDRYIVYTGGTTGLPKGVVWRQEDLVYAALNEFRGNAPIESVESLGEEAAGNESPIRMLVAGPLMHGGSQWTMGNTHVGGGVFALYCSPRFDPIKLLDLVESSGTNSLALLGDAMARPVMEALLAEPDRWDLSGLFAIANGAAPLSNAVRDQMKQALPNLFVRDSYGASESGAAGARFDDGKNHAAPRFDVGEDISVLSDDGRVCGPGEIGMLARSGHIPLGYYNDEKKTRETFREAAGKRWVVPGDSARREEDGSITLLGRGSVSINTGGEKVHPEEVESVLKEHPDVFDAAVVGTPHERWGQQVTALVEIRPGADLSEEGLATHCREHLAAFKVPKVIFGVEEVPRTPVSKVDYKAVAARAQELVEQRG